MALPVFHRVGPYEILEEIGRGGMAVVFLARDTRSGQQLALKLVPQGTDREALEILGAERWGAELQKQFSAVSSHVPKVFDYGVEAGYFFVAMEYLDGENLSDAISAGPMPPERALSIAVELCRFVEDAHRFEAADGERQFRSLLHGDLKPRNIRLTSTEGVKVLDFGIAKALSMSRKVTRNDFGSVAYLSPERLESGDVDQQADFWAIGVLLYELLTGVQAFRAPDTRRLEKQIVSRQPPPLLAELQPLPLRAIVAKLLGPYPQDRYASAADIREDIERVSAGATTHAEEEGWPRALGEEQPTRRTQPGVEVVDEPTRRTTRATIQPPPIPGAGSPVAPAVSPTRKPLVRAGRVVAVLLFLFMVIHELSLASAASRLTGAVPTTELDELIDVWDQYDQLSRRSYLHMATGDLASALSQHTQVLADRVIANYRAPLLTVREAQWRVVRTALVRATITRPDDKRLRGTLRYCDGHLNRIDGEARKSRRQVADAQRKFAEAVTAFREAAELRPDWPDPFLGLARTFIYGLDDVDRGADALGQAQRVGYTPGDRDAAQLGDGYRARADSLARSARDVAGLTQERDYLLRAAGLYREALGQYTKAADFAGVPRNVALAQRGLDQVERRLAAIAPPSPGGVERTEQPWA